MMRDPITMAGSDPSCLLCLTADADGSWWSMVGGAIQPSPPRNFMTEPMRFYELADIAQTIGNNDDFEVGFRLRWFSDPTGLAIVPFGNQPYDFRINNHGNVYFYCSAGKITGQTQISMMVPAFAINTVGIYEIRASVVGATATLYVAELDDFGNVLRSASSQAAITERHTPTSQAYMISQFGGTILDAWVSRNGRRIWGYPSRAEYLRLITRAGMRSDRGIFESGNAVTWTIKTAVPANTAGTVLAKLNGAIVTNPTQWNRPTATFHGAVGDKLEWLLVFNRVLTAGEIAGYK